MSHLPDGSRAVAVLHTVAGLVPVFSELVGRHLPDWRSFAMVDESLLGHTIRDGFLSPLTTRRLATLVWSAADAGASAILVTCSTLGPAVDAIVPLCPVPLFRVDDGMAIEAIAQGNRIGILATLRTTLEPTTRLIERHAARLARDVTLHSRLCEGAFDSLRGGDRAGHDTMIRDGFAALSSQVDLVVLAQASMAKALDGADDHRVPVLTSPELGVRHMARALGAPRPPS